MNSIELKGSSFTLSVLKLQCEDLNSISQDLAEKVSQAPQFFANAPVIADLEQVATFCDFTGLAERLHQFGMFLTGVINIQSDAQKQAALAAKLPQLNKGIDQKTVPQAEPKKEGPVQQPTKLIRQPVRSGQQIYAQHADLVILGSVGNGAEVAADGNIHIYGTLRGRAIAGANGNNTAQIFCQNLQAELVSIGGHYCLSDTLENQLWQQACSIKLENNKIVSSKL